MQRYRRVDLLHDLGLGLELGLGLGLGLGLALGLGLGLGLGFDLPDGDDHQAARAEVRVHGGHEDVGEARLEQVRAHLLRVRVG